MQSLIELSVAVDRDQMHLPLSITLSCVFQLLVQNDVFLLEVMVLALVRGFALAGHGGVWRQNASKRSVNCGVNCATSASASV